MPTTESVLELFDVLHLDDFAGQFIDQAVALINAEVQDRLAKKSFTPAQLRMIDELNARFASILSEELNVDHVRQIVFVVIQQSFSQQDVDTVTAFYKTKAGKSILAAYAHEVRAYTKQKSGVNDGSIKTDGEAPLPDSKPSLRAFFKPWENPEFAKLYGSAIEEDIEARMPAADQIIKEEAQALEERIHVRLRKLLVEYQAKIRAPGSQ
jgi:Uncharacterized protein conserved in bacteria (DUF2059)